MKIGNVDCTTGVALIAEIGNNHEGSVALAEELIGLAHEAGADAVKLQTFVPELYVTSRDADRMAMLKRFALPFDETIRLVKTAEESGIHVFSTPFDVLSVEKLGRVTRTFKVSSGDITFKDLLSAIGRQRTDTIISTGASHLTEVEAAVDTVTSFWTEPGTQPALGVLHCVSAYPADASAVNLRAITTLKNRFPFASVGFSDHTLGIDVPILAVAAGASIIEKHFTIDKEYSSFRDHTLSAEPQELRELRKRIDDVFEQLGSGEKVPHPSELNTRKLIRRSITAARDLQDGHNLSEDDLICVRPGEGLPPAGLAAVLGRHTALPIQAGEAITESKLR